MVRHIEPELLDSLPCADPGAMRSRLDLRRLNAWMGSAGIMARALQSATKGQEPRRLLELGAGDGTFLLEVARRLQPGWARVNASLLDRQNLVEPETLAAFQRLGWQAEMLQCDIVDGPQGISVPMTEVTLANLFLHHFAEDMLAALFQEASTRTRIFVALEPRRAPLPLFFSHMVWAIGCNQVTRHDAAVSVRAGFTGTDLSRLWPTDQNWSVQERAVGWFGHLFVAQRLSGSGVS